MAQENEHKYLVQSAAWRKQARSGEHYRQGYLSSDPDRSVRVRVSGDNAVLIVKGEGSSQDGLQRAEFEFPIPVADANQILDHLCLQPLIEKTRFRVPQNGSTWEVDKFEKENEGLVIAELEPSNGHGGPAHLPPWVGEEVSKDDRYTNANLVEHPYSEWRAGAQKPDPKYHWKAGERVGEGLQRIVAEQLQLAIWELSGDPGPTDHAVHEARKCLKKSRSAMRLLQNVLGQEYEKGNAALRDAGRKLSPVRDSEALIEMFDQLHDKYRDDWGERSLVSVREGLVKRKKKLSRDFQQKHVRGAVLKSLRSFAARVDKWKVSKADLPALSKSFARTIRRNQQACRDAYAESRPDSFHEWRKRAKDLRYHLNLVSKAWPEVLDGYEAAAKDLESKLGDDHNLVVMRDTILEKPTDFGKEEDVSAFLKIIDEHQNKLRSDCRTLADRLYTEKPKHWRRRLDLCWTAWKEERA